MANIKTAIDRKKDLVIHTFVGKITADEIINYFQKFFPSDKPAAKPMKNSIWDFTQAKGADIPDDAIITIAQKRKKFDKLRQGGKTALVFSRDVGYGLGRMYESHAKFEGSTRTYTSFYSIEDALKWLEE